MLGCHVCIVCSKVRRCKSEPDDYAQLLRSNRLAYCEATTQLALIDEQAIAEQQRRINPKESYNAAEVQHATTNDGGDLDDPCRFAFRSSCGMGRD
jgi:hypothetical protein